MLNYGSKYRYTVKTDKFPTDYVVYKATSPSGKIYIGQTISGLTNRISKHLSESKTTSKNRAFLNAIRKYGIENITWEIIDYCGNEKELDEKERYYIKQYDSLKNGYNETIGGDKGNKGFIYSLELREKMAISQGGKPFNVYSLDGKLIDTYINQNLCANELNIRSNLVNSCLNNKANIHKGYIFIYCDNNTEDFRKIKLDNARKIKTPIMSALFNVYSIEGIMLGGYSTTVECSKDIDVSHQNISSCLREKKPQNNKYIFIYDDINTGLILSEILDKYNSKFFNVYEKETGRYVNTFSNQTLCCTELNIKDNAIGRCLNKEISSHKGYYFINLNEDNEVRLQELLNKPKKNIGKIFNVYKDEEFIGSYDSQVVCSQELKLTKSKICACLSEKNKTHKGYTFYYFKDIANKEDDNNI